jgi:putative MATE family efflux protein
MDTVMLGSLGDKQISAASLANQPFFIFTVFMFGLSSGASVLTAQYWGKGDTAAISRIIALAIKAAVLCSIVFSLVVLIFPRFIISIYTSDVQVIDYGTQFLRIVGFSYLLSAISTTYLFILRSVESVKVPLLISLSTFIVSTGLSWVLIFGKFGMPALGIRGSAIGNLSARVLELIIAMIYCYCFEEKLKFRLRDIFKTDIALLKDFLHYSTPVVLNETLWAVGISIQSIILGRMGTEVLTANSIAGVVQRFALVTIMGVASFAAVAVGKQIGAGNMEKAKNNAFTLLILSIGVGVVSSAVILLMRGPTLAIYSVSAMAKNYANQILTVYSVTIFFTSFNYTNVIGVLRGGGDTRFAMFLDLTTLWVVALPLGAFAAFVLHWPLIAIFFLLTMDEYVKFFIGIFRFKSGKWLKNLTR